MQQALERLNQRRIGDVAPELVEFAGDEVAPAACNGLVYFVDQRGFSYARISGHQSYARRPVAGTRIGIQQTMNFDIPAVEPGGKAEALGYLVPARHEVFERAVDGERFDAFVQVAADAGGALIAVLRIFRDQFVDHARYRNRDGCILDVEFGRHHGDVLMHQFHAVLGVERAAAEQQFVESDAQRVVIAAVIDRPVHASGLFRRDVGERAFEVVRVLQLPVFMCEPSGVAEIDDLDFAGLRVDQDVVGVDVLVDDAVAVHVAKDLDDTVRDSQLVPDVERIFRSVGPQGNATEILHDDGERMVHLLDAVDFNDAGVIKAPDEIVLVTDACELDRLRELDVQNLQYHRCAVRLALSSVEGYR